MFTPKNDFHGFNQRIINGLTKSLRTNNLNIVIKRACNGLKNYDEHIQQNTIKLWSERFNIPISYFQSRLTGEEEHVKKLSSIELMQNELLKYTIEQDKLLKSLTITDNITGEELQKNELKYRLKKAGLKFSKEDFDNVLEPLNKTITVVKQVNPIKQIFEDFAQNYRGGEHIQELANSIPIEEFKDEEKPEGYYRKKMEYFLRKWLYLTAGQALGICSNHAMLLWVCGTGGTGKTYLNRWLGEEIKALTPYYTEIIGAGEYAPYGRLAIEKFFLNFDELPLGKKRYNEFKGIVSSDTVQIYSKTVQRRITYDKLGVFLGSTNKSNRDGYDGYMTENDGGMMRRIIPIELPPDSRIDWKRYTKIDVEQLWGEAANGIIQAHKMGNENMLTYTKEDHEYLKEANKRYMSIQVSNAKPYLKQFIKDAPLNHNNLKSSSEIMDFITKKGYKVGETTTALGMMLSKAGFKRGRRGDKRGYFIEFIN